MGLKRQVLWNITRCHQRTEKFHDESRWQTWLNKCYDPCAAHYSMSRVDRKQKDGPLTRLVHRLKSCSRFSSLLLISDVSLARVQCITSKLLSISFVYLWVTLGVFSVSVMQRLWFIDHRKFEFVNIKLSALIHLSATLSSKTGFTSSASDILCSAAVMRVEWLSSLTSMSYLFTVYEVFTHSGEFYSRQACSSHHNTGSEQYCQLGLLAVDLLVAFWSGHLWG